MQDLIDDLFFANVLKGPDQLVKGGTEIPDSNRALELASELQKADAINTQDLIRSLIGCETLDEVDEVLQMMEKNNYNFVGSRGYVYLASRMREGIALLKKGSLCCDMSGFTRSCGLRYKVAHIMGEIDDDTYIEKMKKIVAS